MAAPPLPIRDYGRCAGVRLRLLVAVAAAAFALAACGATAPSVQPTGGSFAASPGVSVGESAEPASSAVKRCAAADLTAAIAAWQGSSGSRYAAVAIASRPGVTCSVRGTPGVRLLDGNGKVVLDSAKIKGSGGPIVTPADPVVVLTPAAQLHLDVQWANWCRTQPARPLTVAFVLTDSGGLLKAAKATRAGDDDAPPCADPSRTSQLRVMHAWQAPGG